ncbi:MAG TPA: YggT family protein [Steroidobacteraceae bacterium]
MQALLFVFDTLITLVVIAFLLRVLLPLLRADFRNPIGQAVLKFTDPLVVPLRRVIPPAGRVDLASVVALLLVQFAGTLLLRLIAGHGFDPAAVVMQGLLSLLRTVLQFYFVAILIYALLSWVSPGTYSPANQLLARICEPLLTPVRRVIPPLGGLDLSALFVLIALQALQILLS